MTDDIPVTDARARFSELVNRVGFGKERIVLSRHGKPLVALVPAEDLEELAAEPPAFAAAPPASSVPPRSAPERPPSYLDLAARVSDTPTRRLPGP